jgi:hypothetical protein
MKDWTKIESPSERHQRIERENIEQFERLLLETYPELRGEYDEEKSEA